MLESPLRCSVKGSGYIFELLRSKRTHRNRKENVCVLLQGTGSHSCVCLFRVCLTSQRFARPLSSRVRAQTCPLSLSPTLYAQQLYLRHKVGKMREVCQNTKFMMMHVRDCPGTTSTFDVCPFPWCRKVKHLLYHLVSCEKPEQCSICTPKDISPTLKALRGLNAHRHKKHREKLRAAARAALSARASAICTVTKSRTPVPAPLANLKKGCPMSKSDAKSGIARHPGAVPNPTGKAPAVQPNHPGAPNAAKVSHGATKATAPKPAAPKHPHPGASVNPLNKDVPVPLRGSTPNPILPSDTEDSAIASNISVPSQPTTKSPTPLPVSNPLAGAPSVPSDGEKADKGSTLPARGDTPPKNGCAGQATAGKASVKSARLVEE